MEQWIVWMIAGVVMIVLEFFIPGGIIVFLGMAAFIVGALVYFKVLVGLPAALITWFISSIVLMLFLRSLFMKYFEGDSKVQNVDEDQDLLGSIVEIVEEVLPHKEGRVRFRNTTWIARSDHELSPGTKATVCGRDGNSLIIKSL